MAHLFEGLAEDKDLELIVDRQHTSTSHTTENVGTGTLEQRLGALLGNNLSEGIHGAAVLDGLARGHHHAATNGVKRVRGDTGTSGDAPTQKEGGQEVVGQVADQDDGLDGVVQTEVQTTVDNNAQDGRAETTVQTSETVGGQGLAVDVNQAVELALATLLGRLGVVGQTGTGVVQGVDEQQRCGTSSLSITLSAHQRPRHRTGGAIRTPPDARLPTIHMA